MKKRTILFAFATVVILVLTTGCVNDNVVGGKASHDEAIVGELTSFASISNSTRTSLSGHKYLTGGDFMWETGDYIYVKGDNDRWEKSISSDIKGTQPMAKFKVSGVYVNNSYEVRYTGAQSNSSTVTIAAQQNIAGENNTKHFGEVGDCGVATATRSGNEFKFMLDHKASYLCLLPFIANEKLITYSKMTDIYVTKVVIKSNNNIAGIYTLTSQGLIGDGTDKQITLSFAGNGSRVPLNRQVSGAIYAVIAPGEHSVTIDYTVSDPITGVQGTFTKQLPSSIKFEANQIYDVSMKLPITDYSHLKYYMWDAKKSYWEGHEWYTSDPWQPNVSGETSSNYAKDESDDRWFNSVSAPTPASNSCKECPNINEVAWSVLKGDPYWDATTLWSTMGHLYNNGVWLKKKAVIMKENNITLEQMRSLAPNGNDYVNNNYIGERNVKEYISGKPLDIANYNYYPALGAYTLGRLIGMNSFVVYWSSNTIKGEDLLGYNIFGDLNKFDFNGVGADIETNKQKHPDDLKYTGCIPFFNE